MPVVELVGDHIAVVREQLGGDAAQKHILPHAGKAVVVTDPVVGDDAFVIVLNALDVFRVGVVVSRHLRDIPDACLARVVAVAKLDDARAFHVLRDGYKGGVAEEIKEAERHRRKDGCGHRAECDQGTRKTVESAIENNVCNQIGGHAAECEAEDEADQREAEHIQSAENGAEEHTDDERDEQLDKIGGQIVGKRVLGAFGGTFFDQPDGKRQTCGGKNQPVDDVAAFISRQRIERLHDEAVVIEVSRHAIEKRADGALDEQRGDGIGEVDRYKGENRVDSGAAADGEQ